MLAGLPTSQNLVLVLVVRNWLTTREVQQTLGNLSQQRISQLVRNGILVAERDGEGRLQYDRESVERLREHRAIQRATSVEDADERKAIQIEARDRFRRQRDKEIAEERARIMARDELQRRQVDALEGIVQCLRQMK